MVMLICEFFKISLIWIVFKCLVCCYNVLEWEGYLIEIIIDNWGWEDVYVGMVYMYIYSMIYKLW